MNTWLLRVPALLAVALLAGCGTSERRTGTESRAEAPAAARAPSGGPPKPVPPRQRIARFTDQIIVYECPRCRAMYDGPGSCADDGTKLFAEKLTYICPYDGSIAARLGPCPHCGRPLAVEKAQMLATGIRVVRLSGS